MEICALSSWTRYPEIVFFKTKSKDDFAIHDLNENTRRKQNVPEPFLQIRDIMHFENKFNQKISPLVSAFTKTVEVDTSMVSFILQKPPSW